MKKLITILATTILATGAVANSSFWITKHQSQQQKNTPAKASNETAGDICRKLWGKAIGLHASYWVGKDIFNYHQQLADAIVKDGILTQDEVQYVSWGHLLINEPKHYTDCSFTIKKDGVTSVAKYITLWVSEVPQDIANKLNKQQVKLDPQVWMGRNLANYQQQLDQILVTEHILDKYEAPYVHWNSFVVSAAKYYWSCSFNVYKVYPRYGASGAVSINATTGETTKQIAAKLEKANIQFNYNYWNNKTVTNYLPLIRSILVNEKILSTAEASDIVGFLNPVTITKPGATAVNFNVNDGNTNTYAYTNLNVVNDGNSAEQIAANIQNKFYGLKQNTVGMYADSSYVTNDFRSLLVNSYDQGSGDMSHVTLPHVKLEQDNKNIKSQVTKDGQNVTANIELVDYTSNYLFYNDSSDTTLTYYLNLNPTVVNVLKKFFPTAGSKDDLGYFLNVLDDGNDNDNLPHYNGTSYFPWWQRLDVEFQQAWDIDGKECLGYLDNLKGSGAAFESELYKQVMNSNGYVSIMMNVQYVSDYDVETTSYAFW